MSEQYPLSWARDWEDNFFLRSLPREGFMPRGDEVRLDPRPFLRVENQGSVGACQGHSLSSSLEWCYRIATGGESIQLSRAMAYYESQRIDKITGDRGSTIAGGIKLGMNTGICVEELWKYTGRYNPARPVHYDDVLMDASKYKLGRAVNLRSYTAVRSFLGSGQGAVHLGILWSNRLNTAVLESYSDRGASGGHAISLYALSEREDSDGNPYVWMMNSWSSNWGNKGWAEWSPAAVGAMIESSYSHFVGVSDMPHVSPRKFTVEDWMKRLRV